MDTFADDPFPAGPVEGVPYPRLDRHRRFAERYVIDFDRAAALEAAGYAARASLASSLLLQPAVAVYVEYLLRRQAAESEHTAAEVLAELWRNHRAAQSDGDLKTSNAALVAYGKHLGMFAEVHHHAGNVGVTHVHIVTGVPVPALEGVGDADAERVLIAPSTETKQ